MLKVLDLFSGIGGMALGMERTGGFKVHHFVEIDPYRRAILRRHWPRITITEDVHQLSASELHFSPDWVIGGPPCHRTSIAAAIHGKRTGETLWPEQLRLIKESNPYGTIVEQPPKNQAWERKVCSDLEGLGLEVSSHVISAASVGAPHLRERVFIIAHRYGKRLALPRSAGPSEITENQGLAPAGGNWNSLDSRVLRMDDGVPGGLVRKERIMACGSSCVPQVATFLGRLILSNLKGKK